MEEEQIDILNPNGTKKGFAKGRTEVHAKGLWHRTVHIWAFDKEGRILFQLRSHLKENNPSLLDTSCAGHISAGDDSLHAGIRELKEELGISKRIEELEYLFEATHENILNGGSYLDNEFYDTYKITLNDEEIKLLSPQYGEVDDFVWMTTDEFTRMHAEHPEKFVEHPKDFAWIREGSAS